MNNIDKIVDIKESVKNYFNEKGCIYGIDRRNIIIAGGFFKSMFHGERPKDYDVFILNSDSELYISDILKLNLEPKTRFRETDSTYIQNEHIKKVFLDIDTNIQYIFTNYKTRQDLIESFDMQHCKVSYEPFSEKLYISPKTLDVIENKKIVICKKGSVTEFRIDKLLKKGWSYDVSV